MPKKRNPDSKPVGEQQGVLLQRLDEMGVDMKTASLWIGRNPAYMQQYIFRGTPQHLDEPDRVVLAQRTHLREDQLDPRVRTFGDDRGAARTATMDNQEGLPSDEWRLRPLWRQLSDPQRQRVIAFIEGMLASQAAPTPPAPPATVTTRFKPQPEIPRIGGHREMHVYLAEWMDYRNMEPHDLAKRTPGTDAATIRKLIAGDMLYDEERLEELARALSTTVKSLHELPPPKVAKAVKRKVPKR